MRVRLMSDLVPLHLTWLRAGGRSPRTIEHRQLVLERADRELPWGLDEAAPDELAEHMASRDWSVATRHVYDSHLRGYYRWGVAAGHLTGDPMMHLIRPPSPRHVPRPVTEAELALALAGAPEWLRTAVMLASYAGLRCSEIARARREDVTAEHIRVIGKGRKVAMVDMAPQLWSYLEPRPPGPLVMFRGRQLDGRELTHLQKYPFRKLGLAVTLHRFRHWFATELLRRGADIRTVQELVRHASLATTQGYTAVVDAQRRAAVRLLPPMSPEPAVTRFGAAAGQECPGQPPAYSPVGLILS